MDCDFSSLEAASIPSELNDSLPRKLHLSRNGARMMAAAVIMFALAVVFALWVGVDYVQQLRHRAALRDEGRETVGEITRLWSAGRSLKTRVRYTFVVSGVSFAGESLVPRELVPNLDGLSTLLIRYLPANPTINHPAIWEWSALSDWDSLVAPIIAISLSLFLFTILHFERRLVAKGIPVVGEITQCVPGRRGGFSVMFRFRAQDGNIFKGSSWSEHHREVGERACVLYFPQNPRRNLSYPSLNYRVSR